MPFDRFQALLARRGVLSMIVWRDVTIRYKQSIMGILWAVLMPLVIVGAGILVRSGMAILTGGQLDWADVAAVSLKAVPWAFTVGSIRFATGSLIGNANLLTKIYLPREIFPLAAVGSQMVDFAVATVPLVIVLAVARVGLSIYLLWVPILIAILILQVAAFGILFSAASLFFRDVKYLVDIGLTFAIFVTPVFFDVEMFGRWSSTLLLNPLAPLFEGLTTCVLEHQMPNLAWVAYSTAVGVGAMTLAVAVFHRLEPYFAESV